MKMKMAEIEKRFLWRDVMQELWNAVHNTML